MHSYFSGGFVFDYFVMRSHFIWLWFIIKVWKDIVPKRPKKIWYASLVILQRLHWVFLINPLKGFYIYNCSQFTLIYVLFLTNLFFLDTYFFLLNDCWIIFTWPPPCFCGLWLGNVDKCGNQCLKACKHLDTLVHLQCYLYIAVLQ